MGITDIKPLPITSWNMVLYAESPKDKYLVKIYNESKDNQLNADPLFIATVQKYLSLDILPEVIAPIGGKQGQLTIDVEGYNAVLYPWIEGHIPTTNQYKDCSRLLFKIHEIERQELKNVEFIKSRFFFPSITPILWAKNQAILWEMVYERISQACLSDSLLHLLYDAKHLSKRYIQDHSLCWNNADSVFLHGDYRPSNILVKANNLNVFDFDCIQIGPPELDLAYAALTFGGAEWLGGKIDENFVISFISDYLDARGCSSIDRQKISKIRLKAALTWVPLRALSLSFKKEQIKPRIELVLHLEKESSSIIEQAFSNY